MAVAGAEPVEPVVRRRTWPVRLLKWLAIALIGMIALIALAAVVIDSAPGKRFIIDRIERLAPESGLRIRIGRIDGR